MAERARNEWHNRTPASLLSAAKELAEELGEEREKFYVLAAAIVDRLRPDDKGNSPDPTSRMLAKIIEDLAAECGQNIRLVEYLEAAAGHMEARHHGRERAHQSGQ